LGGKSKGSRENFGIQRLVELVQQNYNLPAEEIIQQICQVLADFLQDKPLKNKLIIAVAKIV